MKALWFFKYNSHSASGSGSAPLSSWGIEVAGAPAPCADGLAPGVGGPAPCNADPAPCVEGGPAPCAGGQDCNIDPNWHKYNCLCNFFLFLREDTH